MEQRIVLQKRNLPSTKRLEEDIEWLCESLGLVAGRDTERTAAEIFRRVLQQHARGSASLSTTLMGKDLTQASVNHHLRFLVNTGILERHNREIVLRGGSVRNAITEMQRDADRIFQNLLVVAESIDSKLGIKNRRS